VHQLRVPEVVEGSLDGGGAHKDGRVLDRLGMPVVPQHILSRWIPNRRILAGRGEDYALGQQVCEHRQLVVSLAPVYLDSFHPHDVPKGQPLMCRLHIGEEHPQHSRVALTKISPTHFTGISRTLVTATTSNS
jgi:hypothetical protein